MKRQSVKRKKKERREYRGMKLKMHSEKSREMKRHCGIIKEAESNGMDGLTDLFSMVFKDDTFLKIGMVVC